ncbi:aldo/keto reductase [Cutibacterium sp.]|uniref:aldo/keto reductase n=1 Tax=Cutibacterium sp. TaxID=1912221 RepID=UPI0026DB9050|nr:aldo/keto reductase [Cutibacterium sp.]MDO4411496.1 aldo/keto reductase [Cutibacterium sp.]
MIRISGTDLDIKPLVLGANTFGWTANEHDSHAILDAFVGGGGSLVDTADGYSHWAEGNAGGESEKIIGSWLEKGGSRDDILIATKVSTHPEFKGLSPENISAAVDASLARLHTDHIDLYYAHYDDDTQQIEDMAAAFDKLVKAGKVRWVGLSNFSVAREQKWFEVAEHEGLARPVALQPQYNLLHRADVEDPQGYGQLASEYNLALFPYFSLASGFLTGKYATREDLHGVARESMIARYLPDGEHEQAAFAVLDRLREIAGHHGVEVASVSLAWLMAKGVTAPIASARTVDQLGPLLAATDLALSHDEVRALDAASELFTRD